MGVTHTALIKKYFLRISAILLPAGTGVIAVGVTLMMVFAFTTRPFVLPVICLIFGNMSLYVAVLEKRRARFYFTGTFLLLLGLLTLLVDYGVLELTLTKLWPMLVMFIGLSLIPAGINRYHRLHPIYIVPTTVFIVLGLFFLLFSTDIIKAPLASVAAWWFPLLLLPVLGVVLLWLHQQRKAAAASGSE